MAHDFMSNKCDKEAWLKQNCRAPGIDYDIYQFMQYFYHFPDLLK